MIKMPFDLEQFKVALQPFGTLTYAILFYEGQDNERLEFVVDDVNYL